MCAEPKASYRMVQYEYVYHYTPARNYEIIVDIHIYYVYVKNDQM